MKPKRKSKVLPKLSRNLNSEKELAKNLLEGFTAKGSKGEALIEQIINQEIRYVSRKGLIQLGSIIGAYIGIDFPRNYGRKRDLTIKWFDDNEQLITPIAHNIRVDFCNGDQEQNQYNAESDCGQADFSS